MSPLTYTIYKIYMHLLEMLSKACVVNSRFMHHLKKKVHNKAQVEGSICEAYAIEEIVTFCSLYFEPNIETRFNQVDRNFDGGEVDTRGCLSIFTHQGRAIGGGISRFLDDQEFDAAILYILSNCEEISLYIG